LDEAAAAFDANTLAFELEKAMALEMDIQYYSDLYYSIVETQKLLAEGLQVIEQGKRFFFLFLFFFFFLLT